MELTIEQRGGCTIIQFPRRSRPAPSALRRALRPDADVWQPARASVDPGAWYHQAAIEDAEGHQKM